MNFNIKSFALAISICCTTLTLPAHAALITSTIESSVTIVENDSTHVSYSDGPASDTNTQTMLNYSSGVAFGTHIGRDLLHVEAGGNGCTVLSKLHKRTLVHNDSASIQSFMFNFLISPGSLDSSQNPAYLQNSQISPLNGNDFLNASYSVDIQLNGRSIWASSAVLLNDAQGSHLTTSGQVLGDYNNFKYSWNALNKNIHLGQFLSSESFALDYFMTASAQSSAAPASVCYDIYSLDCHSVIQFGYATLGDPFSDYLSPLDNTTIYAISVPESTGIVLLSIGLLGISYRRKIKQRKPCCGTH